MRSAWDNYQLFMPEKFYLLNEEQTNLYKEVQTIFPAGPASYLMIYG